MSRRVVITGLGVISSIGIGWQEFWQNLLAGKSGIGPVTSIDTSKHFTHNGGEAKNFRPEDFMSSDLSKTLSRASQMGLAAAKLAVSDSGMSSKILAKLTVGASFGTTTGSIQVIEPINDKMMAGQPPSATEAAQLPPHTTAAIVSRELKLTGPNVTLSTACAAGNYAIGYGYDLIRSGKADIVIAGASDAFARISFTGFNQFSAVAPEKCQPFDKNRKGMMVAEGAGALILEPLDIARERKATIYAEVLGYGLSCDAFHMTTSAVEGLTACMKKALHGANIRLDEIDYVNAHGTGTAANDRNECAALKNVFGDHLDSVPVSSIKSMLGHTMGAASLLEAITCALSVQKDMIAATINFETLDPECAIDCVPNRERKHAARVVLNNSYAFGGNNASLVVSKYIQ